MNIYIHSEISGDSAFGKWRQGDWSWGIRLAAPGPEGHLVHAQTTKHTHKLCFIMLPAGVLLSLPSSWPPAVVVSVDVGWRSVDNDGNDFGVHRSFVIFVIITWVPQLAWAWIVCLMAKKVSPDEDKADEGRLKNNNEV